MININSFSLCQMTDLINRQFEKAILEDALDIPIGPTTAFEAQIEKDKVEERVCRHCGATNNSRKCKYCKSNI